VPERGAAADRGAQVQEVPAASVPEGAWLLDVRENEEWAAGYAPGARHIPLGELGSRTTEIPQDQPVYVICRSGGRSARAAQALAAAGWETVNVSGGMQDWAAAGRPMATDSGAAPFVA
jgi:rhodanese-related sulfurtransferase